MIQAASPEVAPGAGLIRSVQALRAIAALFVVGFHSTVLWHDKFAPGVTLWENGNSGVDLFFVISGFIMALSSRRLIGQTGGWFTFMVLRLVRIVPMYWLATAAKLAAMAAVPDSARHTSTTAWNIIASFMFLPSHDATGMIKPVLDVGWTLSFEMLFYLVFASALFFLVEPLLVVGLAMAALAALSFARTTDTFALDTLANPIVLEFVFGVLIGRLFLARSLTWLSSPWMILASAAGLFCLAFLPTGDAWSRVAVWGVAAAATLACSNLAERWLDQILPQLFEEIGDASYSLYLVHGFVLPIVGFAVAKMGLAGNTLGVVLIALCLIASTLTALVVYRTVEVPITNWLRRRVHGRRRASSVAPS